MGDDSQIILKGKGTIKLEHDNFYDVRYVFSTASNLLSVYQMTHIGLYKRLASSPNHGEIS